MAILEKDVVVFQDFSSPLIRSTIDPWTMGLNGAGPLLCGFFPINTVGPSHLWIRPDVDQKQYFCIRSFQPIQT